MSEGGRFKVHTPQLIRPEKLCLSFCGKCLMKHHDPAIICAYQLHSTSAQHLVERHQIGETGEANGYQSLLRTIKRAL